MAEEPDVISAFHQLQKLHQEFREIGPVAKELREEVWTRFKEASTVVNKRHQQHFEELKQRENDNLEKKTALCEQAEALQDSTDWKGTADKLAALQREWKAIGPVPKKLSDAIWKRFNAACDAFFEKRKAATSSQRTEEQENLAKKRAIIEQLSAINPEAATSEDQAKMHDLIKEWNSIGHVPFREKDKIYKQYKALIDALFDTFQKNEATRRVARYKDSIKEGTNIANVCCVSMRTCAEKSKLTKTT